MARTKPASDPDIVTVYPSAEGLFFDGIPSLVQEVSAADAEWMCRHGVFTRELPEGLVVDDEGRVVRPTTGDPVAAAAEPEPDPDTA